ncbi:E3 ubiquitin-protein ligase E3D isoform X2 [Tamandua tetradactyla]|uniref:E3 ubiquitin-protein ligase E3D isoform X2 n=1 Tax=Tamandua tetradactyla TaxID=48850 RepID=UPI004053EF17
MEGAAKTRTFLEVRRRLQSALLILGEPKEGGMPMEISIMPSSLQVKTPAGCTEIGLPAEVRLEPSSCGGLQYLPADGLHLRLQARAELSTKPSSMFNQSSQAQDCCTFYCQSCGEVIIRDRKLLRVLPLPCENWGALIEEWCCHPDPFADKPLHPRENDCFTGDSYILVNLRRDSQPRHELAQVEMHSLSSENHCELKPKANTKVICKRCKVMLGQTMSSETTKFYITEIIIQPSERNFPIIPRSQFVQSVIAQCLVELSSARSTFRFTIQGHDGKAYILLWLLNTDSLVIGSFENSKSIKKFPLLEDTLKADSSSAWNAVKVLYQPCVKSRNEKMDGEGQAAVSVLGFVRGDGFEPRASFYSAPFPLRLPVVHSVAIWTAAAVSASLQLPPCAGRAPARLASSWEDDISVHSLTLPSTTCLELLLILARSNATLPLSLRYMNSFQVAFLKM